MTDASHATTGSDQLDVERALARVRAAGLFRSLERLYAALPETTCAGCARCCRLESPGVFYLEYLHLLEAAARLSRERQAELLRRMLHELLFSAVEAESPCAFLEADLCSAYDRRPLACRLFGLVSATDREEAEAHARAATRVQAEGLRALGITVPEAAAARHLESCDRVRDRRGEPVSVNGDALAGRMARLDAALLPQSVVLHEFCFLSVPTRLGAAAFGPEHVDALRLEALRRAQAGETRRAIVSEALARARLPRPLARPRL